MQSSRCSVLRAMPTFGVHLAQCTSVRYQLPSPHASTKWPGLTSGCPMHGTTLVVEAAVAFAEAETATAGAAIAAAMAKEMRSLRMLGWYRAVPSGTAIPSPPTPDVVLESPVELQRTPPCHARGSGRTPVLSSKTLGNAFEASPLAFGGPQGLAARSFRKTKPTTSCESLHLYLNT